MYYAIESTASKSFQSLFKLNNLRVSFKEKFLTTDLNFVMNIISSYKFTRNKLKAILLHKQL